jgi:hypothetical protein
VGKASLGGPIPSRLLFGSLGNAFVDVVSWSSSALLPTSLFPLSTWILLKVGPLLGLFPTAILGPLHWALQPTTKHDDNAIPCSMLFPMLLLLFFPPPPLLLLVYNGGYSHLPVHVAVGLI